MSQMDSQILKFIKRVRKRMTEQNILRFGSYGIIGGFGIAVICSLIALFVPWYYAVLVSLLAVAAGVAAGIVFGILRRPDLKKAALALDAHGFHERLITSYELAGKEDPLSLMQKQDTVRRIGNFQIRKVFPLNIRWQILTAMLGLALIFTLVSLIPSAAKDTAQERHEIEIQAEEETEKIEEAIEHIKKIEDFSEQEREAMIAALEESIKE